MHGSCRSMTAKRIIWTVALGALLICAGETGSARSDLCPGSLMDGTLKIPGTAALRLKASTDGDGAT
jgi:hypothetical protein